MNRLKASYFILQFVIICWTFIKLLCLTKVDTLSLENGVVVLPWNSKCKVVLIQNTYYNNYVQQAGADLGQAQLPTGIWLYCDLCSYID